MVQGENDMKEIFMVNNDDVVATVDDEDYERINEHTWYATKPRPNAKFTARRGVKKGDFQYMHREVLWLKPGDLRRVEHKNENGLDNQKSNLRAYYPVQGKEY